MPSVDSLQQDSNQPCHQKYQPPTHVPTTFKWTQEWGNHICVAGSFDPPVPTWTPIEMPDKEVTLDLLPDKKYYYKFVIDGNWVTDGNIQSHPDSGGNWNHEIQVELPPPPPLEKEKEEEFIEEQLQQEVVSEEQKELHQENIIVEEKHEETYQEEVIIEEKHEEKHQEEVVCEEKHEEEVVAEEKHEEVVCEEKHEKEVVIEEKHEKEIVIEEKHEEVVSEEKHEEEVVSEEKHEEEVVIEEKLEKEIVIEEKHEEEVVSEEKHEEEVVIEENFEKEVVSEEKHEENHQEEVLSEEKHEEEVLVEEKHEVVIEEKHEEEAAIEEKHEEEVAIEEKHQEKVVTEEHQEHQEETEETIAEDHQIVTEDHHVDESEQMHQEEQVMSEEHQEQIKEEQYQHQEDQIDNKIEELHQHKDDQKDQIATIEQTLDDTVIETETITNIESDRTIISNEHISSSSIVKETIIDDVIIEGTQNESMTTESNETLHTSQNDTEPINVIDENVEEVAAQHTEISEIEGLGKEFKVSDETTEIEDKEFKVSDETMEFESKEFKVFDETTEIVNKEFKVSDETEEQTIEQSEDLINESKITTEETSTTKETEMSIESSSFSVTTNEINYNNSNETMPPLEVSHEEKIYEPEHETINKEYDEYEENEENEIDYDYEKEEVREIRENIETEVLYDENLPEATVKEVILNHTWAKDESYEDSVPSSWTESHESQNVVWPEHSNLEWSDINKEQALEKTHESEEVLSCEITSTVLVEETKTEQVESIVEETLTQSIVESHIEQKEKESDETGIGITSEVKEPSFAQYEKPESSATADEMSATPTTVVEEIVTSKAIDKLKSDDMEEKLEVNISRKIVSISPSTSSPGESTRNADTYTHNITLATNATVNISKHKKPVVEITSRGILENDSKDDIPNDGCEEEKIDLNDIAYLVTSVATTFTLGIISMLYSSVFGTKKK